MICRAEKSDAKALTALTIRSKAYWGYGEEQIEKWRDVLTITEKYIEENKTYKLVEDGVPVGYYAYAPENGTDVKLSHLFVCPNSIRKGYGKLLMDDFLKRIEKTAFKRVILDADPHAENFYLVQGFEVIGKSESSIKNRFLPIMAKSLNFAGHQPTS